MSFYPTPAQPATAGFLEAALNPNVSKRIRAISRAAHVHESSWRTWKLEPGLPGLVPLVVSLPNRDAWQAPISLSSSVWTSGQSRAASCSWLLDKIGPAAAGPARFPPAAAGHAGKVLRVAARAASPATHRHHPRTPSPAHPSKTLSGVEGQKAREKPRSLDTNSRTRSLSRFNRDHARQHRGRLNRLFRLC